MVGKKHPQMLIKVNMRIFDAKNLTASKIRIIFASK